MQRETFRNVAERARANWKRDPSLFIAMTASRTARSSAAIGALGVGNDPRDCEPVDLVLTAGIRFILPRAIIRL